jgi:cytochrome P450
MDMNLFSDDVRRNPYPLYVQLRAHSPLLQPPGTKLWMVFDYDGVHRVISDHDTFSSRNGPADWMIFLDPPRQTKLRALISKAFTPRSVINLEPRIRELARDLLGRAIERDRREMDVATDFAVPLPMMVIAEMLGIPTADRPRFVRWNDAILDMSYTIPGKSAAATEATNGFITATEEMNDYLGVLLNRRRADPTDDLLTRLLHAEMDGERLTQQDILGFFQLLLLAGSETTTNLINSAILCFIENPDQLARLRRDVVLLPSAIEEVLRYRSPLQWMFRLAKREFELHGQTLPAGTFILAMIGSANHDPKHFDNPDRFDITRDPNPHIAFGHGTHFCLGAPLARLESKIALTEFLTRITDFDLASDQPWEPRKGLHVHGPNRLPIRFTTAPPEAAAIC